MRLGTGILPGHIDFPDPGDAVTHGGNISIAMASGKIDYLGNLGNYNTLRGSGGGDLNRILDGVRVPRPNATPHVARSSWRQ